ncbi:hypothetical protein BLS_002136 [Venturia inaequalis]|uniref:Uncharacterized protein n=1 Tax=Venturia inaequalis TaxID=5025 RepID=A0A8H3UUN3_VENIN|nr:hypothetical protein BLS_002136 [Venturia inaequalis]KAE9967051.1 hypothetical protein EG327_011639 [Venturia inaequalis]KAE9976936.1 hypothetical protein EG328_002329 [Venturia inaequalis]RDI83975.1 hypothetical protein Vi05172_g6082 [Venturia inaequalis]
MSPGKDTPMIINLPPPQTGDDVATPSDIPGTPNSGTTTMSELSTVAIKDGHRGHVQHHHHPMDAERADRISRLAGLDRMANSPRNLTPGSIGQPSHPTQGYFDGSGQPQIMRERSTVGSASATGSVGGRTTWASGSEMYDADKMSEDQDVDNSSMGGFSDEQSLVGFGEGARTPARQQSIMGSPVASKVSAVPSHLREQAAPSPMSGVSTLSNHSMDAQRPDAKMLDGVTYDSEDLDATDRTPPRADPNEERGQETTERIMRERMVRGRDGEN